MLLRLNLNKFLADERKHAVVLMARTKLRHSTDDALIKVFGAMCELDVDNYLPQLASLKMGQRRPKLHGVTASLVY